MEEERPFYSNYSEDFLHLLGMVRDEFEELETLYDKGELRGNDDRRIHDRSEQRTQD